MNCPLCSEKPAGEFWRGRHFYAIDAGNEDFPAYIRIVACDHVAEMSMLSPALKTELRALLDAAEDEMIAALAPDKMNWAQFGNMVHICTGTSLPAGRMTAGSRNVPGDRVNARLPQRFLRSAAKKLWNCSPGLPSAFLKLKAVSRCRAFRADKRKICRLHGL